MNEQPGNLRHVVIVGGGAGGLELACAMGREARKRTDLEITLCDATHSHLWKPLLHEVAAGSLNSSDDELSYLAVAHWNNFRFLKGAITALDRERREISLSPSLDEDGEQYIPARTVPYDVLVLAIGSVTNDFGIAGVAEHCAFLDAREQADRFHHVFVRACYAADTQDGPVRPGQLHIAIAGGGATGVELAAELQHSIRELVSFGLDRIDVDRDVKIHIIEGADRLLPGLPERVSLATARILENLGVIVHTNTRISGASATAFQVSDGEEIPAEIKVWAAGIKGPDIAGQLDGLEVNRNNQLIVRPTLQTTGDDNVFALGDCAACALPDAGQVPPRAQAAHQQADLLARNIVRHFNGEALQDYRYRDFGSLINLSSHTAIGNLMGNLLRKKSTDLPVEGWFARLAYVSLYRLHQVAISGVLRTTLMTIADWITRASKPRLKLH